MNAPLSDDAARHAPASRLIWSGLTHPGRVRPNNEDAFLALTFDGHQIHYLGKLGQAAQANEDFVFAVSDGMGGARSGEFASRIAVDTIAKLLPRGFRLSAAGVKGGFQDMLSEVFARIDRDLTQLGRSYEECSGMGATLSLCWFTPGWMYFGHVGDSRIYYLPFEGAFTQLTHDHSHVGWLQRTGKLSEREARSHPRRNALNQALGAGHQFLDPHIGAVSCQPGDRFLVCSDGLVDGLWDRQIEGILRDPGFVHALAPTLVETAVSNSGRDNVTAIVIEVAAG